MFTNTPRVIVLPRVRRLFLHNKILCFNTSLIFQFNLVWTVLLIQLTSIKKRMYICIAFLLLPNWHTNFLFIHTNYIKLNSSTCFERNPLIIRRSTKQILYMQSLVSSLSASDRLVQPLRKVTCREWRYQRLHMYNLRRWPSNDERIALETCRGI